MLLVLLFVRLKVNMFTTCWSSVGISALLKMFLYRVLYFFQTEWKKIYIC